MARRLIFSRKGWDSAYGGRPSPVLPDGTMVSLPIPDEGSPLRYGDCRVVDGSSYADLLGRLGVTTIRAPRPGSPGRRLAVADNPGVHLDPDLVAGCRDRSEGWRAVFGQVGTSQSHLANQAVGPGDLFLFFGWFCPVDDRGGGRLRYRGRTAQVQAIWGWMEIGAVLPATQAADAWPWADGHPHLLAGHLDRYQRNNTVYAAAQACSWSTGRAGAGTFGCSEQRQLTKVGETPRVWSLPACLHPSRTPRPLTGQGVNAWEDDGSPCVTLRSACIGQEFVVEATPAIAEWVAGLFDSRAALATHVVSCTPRSLVELAESGRQVGAVLPLG